MWGGGVKITSDGKSRETVSGINQAKSTINKNVNESLQKQFPNSNILQTFARSVELCGNESREKKKVLALINRERRKNKVVFREAGEDRSCVKQLNNRRAQLIESYKKRTRGRVRPR